MVAVVNRDNTTYRVSVWIHDKRRGKIEGSGKSSLSHLAKYIQIDENETARTSLRADESDHHHKAACTSGHHEKLAGSSWCVREKERLAQNRGNFLQLNTLTTMLANLGHINGRSEIESRP